MKEEEIFHQVLGQAVEHRAAFLEAACGADFTMRQRIAILLSAQENPGSFLQHPICGVADSPTLAEPILERIGSQIGPYKLLEEIGQGGMGTVYMAEQKKPVRRCVALKIVKAGMDSRQVLARFDAERQALAMMDHPSIARIIDAGTTELGRPYFVMELVRGIPINEFCDQNRLTVRERLELFLKVCQAVQHAHQKGIIHRDLKPTNVLVTSLDVVAVPKIIDFGIAKAFGAQLTDHTQVTGFAQFLGTPQYMSPEQAEMNQLGVDTRSDVYSLGVVLYELLTGGTPFDKHTLKMSNFDELRRILREEEPPNPSSRISTLHAQALSTVSERRGSDPRRMVNIVRGELDWIVMKALEKDRERRYESVAGLAADIQRYLNDDPVQACPPSTVYRFSKFARKNRAVLTTVSIMALIMLVGTGVSTWQAIRATEAEKQTDHQRQLAVASSLEAQRQASQARLAQAETQLAKQEADRQRNAVTQNLYYADMRLGHVDWKASNIGRLSTKLLEHVPKPGTQDQRGWEWYYLLSLCHQEERTMMYHARKVNSVAWSPNGRFVASIGHEGKVCVYDSISWRPLWTWNGHSPLGANWSPDSRKLAWGTTAFDCGVYTGTLETGEIKRVSGHTSSVWTTAWSPDGKYLASAGIDHTIRVWEAATGVCLQVMEGIPDNVECLAWHPDGKLLASGERSQFSIWDGLSGELLKTVLPPEKLKSFAWSPNGKQLAMGTETGLCLVYRAPDLSLASSWKGHTGFVNSVAWNREGRQLASAGSDGLINVWDSSNGSIILTLRGHREDVTALAWEPTGRRLISGDQDGLVKIWRLPPAPNPRQLQAHSGRVMDIAWGEKSDTLRSVGIADNTIAQWNVIDGQLLGKVPVAAGTSGQFSSGSGQLAIVTNAEREPEVFIHDALSGKRIQTVTKGPVDATCTALSPNGSKLAIGGWDSLVVINVQKNEVDFHWPDIILSSLSWSPDGLRLAGVGQGEVNDGGDMRYAGWVYVFDVEKRECIMKVQHGTHRVPATTVAWSADGQRLASGNINGLVEVWDWKTGRRIANAKLHVARIHAISWSSDGRRVASSSEDGEVSVWDPTNGEELLKLETSQANLTHLKWSPDGHRLAAAVANGEVLIWDAGYHYAESNEYYWEWFHEQLNQVVQRWEKGNHEEALASLEQTIKESKTRTETLAPWAAHSIRSQARTDYTVGHYSDALTLFQIYIRLIKDDVGALESLALLLADCPNQTIRDPKKAVQLAQQAAKLAPIWPELSKTLGIAYYRAGDWNAVIAREMVTELPSSDMCINWFFLSMSHWQLDHKQEARVWYDKAVEWMEKHQSKHKDLMRFRAEADELLGIHKASEPVVAKQPANEPGSTKP